MKIILLFAMILPLALSTSKIIEMQVHTGTYPGSGIEFNGKKLLNFKAFFTFLILENETTVGFLEKWSKRLTNGISKGPHMHQNFVLKLFGLHK